MDLIHVRPHHLRRQPPQYPDASPPGGSTRLLDLLADVAGKAQMGPSNSYRPPARPPSPPSPCSFLPMAAAAHWTFNTIVSGRSTMRPQDIRCRSTWITLSSCSASPRSFHSLFVDSRIELRSQCRCNLSCPLYLMQIRKAMSGCWPHQPEGARRYTPSILSHDLAAQNTPSRARVLQV